MGQFDVARLPTSQVAPAARFSHSEKSILSSYREIYGFLSMKEERKNEGSFLKVMTEQFLAEFAGEFSHQARRAISLLWHQYKDGPV